NRLHLRDAVRRRFDQRDRNRFTSVGEDPRHAAFFSNKADTHERDLNKTQYNLICTSTPAARSSFINASTVLSFGSTMSSTRLCVSVAYWSRASLSACGETRIVYRSILVGKGIGPRTCAPVRLAVSTI